MRPRGRRVRRRYARRSRRPCREPRCLRIASYDERLDASVSPVPAVNADAEPSAIADRSSPAVGPRARAGRFAAGRAKCSNGAVARSIERETSLFGWHGGLRFSPRAGGCASLGDPGERCYWPLEGAFPKRLHRDQEDGNDGRASKGSGGTPQSWPRARAFPISEGRGMNGGRAQDAGAWR